MFFKVNYNSVRLSFKLFYFFGVHFSPGCCEFGCQYQPCLLPEIRGVARILHWGTEAERQRRENRGAKVGLGKGCPPPQPTRESEGAS